MNTEIIKIQPGDGPVSEEDDAKLKAAGEILRRWGGGGGTHGTGHPSRGGTI